MKTLFLLMLLMPDGRQIVWSKPPHYDNIHSCAGRLAAEYLAQEWVFMKTKVKLGYKFICRKV